MIEDHGKAIENFILQLYKASANHKDMPNAAANDKHQPNMVQLKNGICQDITKSCPKTPTPSAPSPSSSSGATPPMKNNENKPIKQEL